MADIAITAANVVPVTSPTYVKDFLAGEAITAGMSLYRKAADGRLYKAKASGTAAEAVVVGIASCNAAAGQPVVMQTGGTITIGGTLVAGTTYVVSTTYGGIAAQADLSSGNAVSFVGYAISTTVLQLNINPTGITV